MLNHILLYLKTDHPHITRRTIVNIYKLFNIINITPYENDIETYARIYFIKSIVSYKVKKNINDFDILIENISLGKYREIIKERIVPEINNLKSLNTENILFLNNFISLRLKYSYLFDSADNLTPLLERLKTNEFDSLEDIVSEIDKSLKNLQFFYRRTRTDDMKMTDVDFCSDEFSTVMTDIVNQLREPTNFLKTGIRCLNELLGSGGFEAGRCYLFLGVYGGFKSALLLSIAKWIRDYNQDYKSKLPDRTPCVLYITQENSIKETMERFFNIAISDKDIRDFTPQQVIQMINESGYMDPEKVNIRIKYIPNKEIDTNDLYTIIDEIEEEGQEVICLIHDYIKRIRPTNVTNQELRLELAAVVDEFCVLAKLKDIPVITVSQLNRSAVQMVEDAAENNMSAIEKLGGSQIGESHAILENVDWAAVIDRFKRKDSNEDKGRYYLAIKNIRTRAKNPKLSVFIHPFEPGSSIRLVEDVNLPQSVSETKYNQTILNEIKNASIKWPKKETEKKTKVKKE